jgi:hypothetical protein
MSADYRIPGFKMNSGMPLASTTRRSMVLPLPTGAGVVTIDLETSDDPPLSMIIYKDRLHQPNKVGRSEMHEAC